MKASRDTRRVNAELVSGVSEPASLSIVRDWCDELCVRWYKYSTHHRNSWWQGLSQSPKHYMLTQYWHCIQLLWKLQIS
jgi:hypothetical protein